MSLGTGARSAAVLLVLGVVSAAGCKARPSLLGGETGIDHVGVAVRDLQAAGQTYHERLGFDLPISGRLANGIDNINFYFEDATYLELLTSHDSRKPDWLAWFIDHFTEGGNFAVLSVGSIEGTADFLRRRGIATSAPSPGSIEVEGGRPGGTWRTLYFERSPLPGSPVFFIEYPRQQRKDFLRKLQDPKIRSRLFSHRNTAIGIRAVWMAVADLMAATRTYASLGLREEDAFDSPRLDARAQAIAAGRGHILLFSPRGRGGPVSEFLAKRGPGVLGLTVEVRSIAAARQVIDRGTAASHETYAGRFGPSILVVPEHAHGTWIEFFQRAGP